MKATEVTMDGDGINVIVKYDSGAKFYLGWSRPAFPHAYHDENGKVWKVLCDCTKMMALENLPKTDWMWMGTPEQAAELGVVDTPPHVQAWSDGWPLEVDLEAVKITSDEMDAIFKANHAHPA